MSTNADEVPDSLVLVALDRARLHRADGESAVPVWAITEHLGVSRRSRRVRAQLGALEASGAIERSRRHGIVVLSLTSVGKRRLTRARHAGSVPALPESPQHARWRNAGTLAGQEIERFREALRDGLTDATRLLDAAPQADSDAFFEAGERLRFECWRLGSATHCLHEWAEPDDEHADVDDRHEPGDDALPEDERARRRYRRNGRRNVSM